MKTPREAIAWFKQTFQERVASALRGTPFSVDLVAAIAQQETGYIWAPLVAKGLPEREVLRLCVGDTLDADRGRSCFPRTKSELVAATRGGEMFAVARQALVDMAKQTPGYAAAIKNPNKFCHGYGIFQYDIQFFKDDPDYFLGQCWGDFDACLVKFVEELKAAARRQGWASKTELTDQEKVFVAIAYNKGTAKCSLGFKQGHKSSGRCYGENIYEYLRIAQTVSGNGEAPIASAPSAGVAPLPPPTVFKKIRAVFEVEVREGPLRLRSAPSIPRTNPNANILARLPDGHLVQRISGEKHGEFIEVETSLNGAYFRGFAAAQFLRRVLRAKRVRKTKAAPGTKVAMPKAAVPVPTPDAAEPTSGVVAIHMPRNYGIVTRRFDCAGAHSLNESNLPGRTGETAAARCAELATIIDFLAVDKSAHCRYQPRAGATFCNIYAHDYCFLAGVYLPRVWWMPGAIERLSMGEAVEPLYENTIDEQRANDLFRWFRDFGLRFGWRQTSTLTKLQEAANLGGIGLIVARRKIDGKSGHIVAVVPETDGEKAKRDPAGNVIAALQSQAGRVNFRYRASPTEWWKGADFADSAFWIHA